MNVSNPEIKYKFDDLGRPIMEERIGWDLGFAFVFEHQKVQGFIENFYEPFAVTPELVAQQQTSKIMTANTTEKLATYRLWFRRPNKRMVHAIDDTSTQIISESVQQPLFGEDKDD